MVVVDDITIYTYLDEVDAERLQTHQSARQNKVYRHTNVVDIVCIYVVYQHTNVVEIVCVFMWYTVIPLWYR
ncbi:hypothetical protein CI610_02979 [invertebrate metagenome]|uniref:Uncharacterized protein n=1 Tax=invertebrate metagenome TaxID=1711999 RepID=A0A2H9T4G1_9ZZZZ